MLKIVNKTSKDIKEMENTEIINPSNFVFYIYNDGVKRVFKYNDNQNNEVYEDINKIINQYKLYEIKLKNALKLNDKQEIKEISKQKKEKFDLVMNKVKEHQKLKNVILTDYKIVEPKEAVDLAIIINDNNEIKIPLIERKNSPYGYAFPGGFIDDGEKPIEASLREANEEVNFNSNNIKKQQIKGPIFYDGIDNVKNFLAKDGIRDPRSEGKGKISTYFFNVELTKEQSVETLKNLKAKSDAKNIKICGFDEIVKILKNNEFAQGHGELLIRTLMTVPEFVTRYNQKKYMFDNDKVLKNMIDGYNKSIKTNIIYDVQDRCIVPNL